MSIMYCSSSRSACCSVCTVIGDVEWGLVYEAWERTCYVRSSVPRCTALGCCRRGCRCCLCCCYRLPEDVRYTQETKLHEGTPELASGGTSDASRAYPRRSMPYYYLMYEPESKRLQAIMRYAGRENRETIRFDYMTVLFKGSRTKARPLLPLPRAVAFAHVHIDLDLGRLDILALLNTSIRVRRRSQRLIRNLVFQLLLITSLSKLVYARVIDLRSMINMRICRLVSSSGVQRTL